MEKALSQAPQCPTPSTTFVQADTNTFRELVQRLTGATSSETQHSNPTSEALTLSSSSSSSSSTSPAVKRSSSSTFKLYERRQCPRPKLQIVKPGSLFKPCAAHPVCSPSPSMTAASQPSDSPTTTTTTTTGFKVTSPSASFSNLSICSPPSLDLNREEEERAIKERRFYLHPSPRSRPGRNSAAAVEPELLPLFPLSSPSTHDPVS